jgi:hypothetical protein
MANPIKIVSGASKIVKNLTKSSGAKATGKVVKKTSPRSFKVSDSVTVVGKTLTSGRKGIMTPAQVRQLQAIVTKAKIANKPLTAAQIKQNASLIKSANKNSAKKAKAGAKKAAENEYSSPARSVIHNYRGSTSRGMMGPNDRPWNNN